MPEGYRLGPLLAGLNFSAVTSHLRNNEGSPPTKYDLVYGSQAGERGLISLSTPISYRTRTGGNLGKIQKQSVVLSEKSIKNSLLGEVPRWKSACAT